MPLIELCSISLVETDGGWTETVGGVFSDVSLQAAQRAMKKRVPSGNVLSLTNGVFPLLKFVWVKKVPTFPTLQQVDKLNIDRCASVV